MRIQTMQNDSQDYREKKLTLERVTSVSLSLASPAEIRSWSSGEVTEEDAFDARIRSKGDGFETRQIAQGGLLCERIFGPIKSFSCACGKYRGGKRARKKEGKVCDHCQVVLASRKVRRQRLGHIELAAPVVHPFFFIGLPCVLAELLAAVVESKARYWVVNDSEKTDLVKGQLLEEAEYQAELSFWNSHGKTFSVKEKPKLVKVQLTPRVLKQVIFQERSFTLGDGEEGEQQSVLTGAEGIKALLKNLDELDLKNLLEQAIGKATSNQKRETLSVLIKMVEGFDTQQQKIRPEWMVLETIPVIPPVSRRVTVLEGKSEKGGERIEVGDLNRLYARIIRRNKVLKTLLKEEAPAELLRRSQRSLQRAVNALFDNEALSRPVKTIEGRRLGSLLGLIKGKTGRFRGSLLGKRVDYSGRAVIVVNPKLRLSECGLPEKIAWKLYRPFVTRRLQSLGRDGPERVLRENQALARENLLFVMASHPVLLNRAPTLHRMNVQAFYPVLSGSNAIELHPLVCRAFNADFDGDQMAVHLPLSIEAKVEAKTLLASHHNLLSPTNGKMVFTPSQDMVMGLFYLTLAGSEAEDVGGVFASSEELELARELGKVKLHEKIEFRLLLNREVIQEGGKLPAKKTKGGYQRIKTTVGRALFNEQLAVGMPFYNVSLSGKRLASILEVCFERCRRAETLRLVEELARLGFSEATRSGLSLGIHDLVIPKKKAAIVKKASAIVKKHSQKAGTGKKNLTALKAKKTKTWTTATAKVAQALIETLRNQSQAGGAVNPVFVMAESGARGSMAQLKQLSGMRGLMARANGEVADHPITSNFREGLSWTAPLCGYFLS